MAEADPIEAAEAALAEWEARAETPKGVLE
jgi:hypothetical protein